MLAYIGLQAVGVPFVGAVGLAYGSAILLGFVVQGRLTFSAPRLGAGSAGRYASVQVAALLVSLAGVALARESLGASKTLAQCVVLPAVAVASFLVHRSWTFGSSDQVSKDPRTRSQAARDAIRYDR